MVKHASLCILAYKRPEQLRECLSSISETADYPHTIIVNLDGDDSGNEEYLVWLHKQKKISYLILNAGNNRGVGRSFTNCLGVAEGDYIFKIDTDLKFKEGWLSTACKILEKNYDIGALSLFNYNHYDPNDKRFETIYEGDNYYLVSDFVSSIYGFRRHFLDGVTSVEDDGFHTKIKSKGNHLAITKKDYVINSGFGVGKSVYVSGTPENPYKTPTHDEPLVFKKGLNTSL